ncbi:MAG: APC family permease, partial [Bacteroidales bacterium]|nr:APC family permease [Bacteroidales bacterium]
MSASRYPLAMSRDKILPSFFSRIGRYKTPHFSILLSSALIIAFILLFNEKGIAKLAGSFQLVIFMLLNFSVIVMRNAKIESYDPGFRSPLYPYAQVIGIITSFTLIIYMGGLAIAFSSGIVLLGYFWYIKFVKGKVERKGAIYHWFALLGRDRYNELELEMIEILREKGLRQGDPFDELIVSSDIEFNHGKTSYITILRDVTKDISTKLRVDYEMLFKKFLEPGSIDPTLVLPQVAFVHARC